MMQEISFVFTISLWHRVFLMWGCLGPNWNSESINPILWKKKKSWNKIIKYPLPSNEPTCNCIQFHLCFPFDLFQLSLGQTSSVWITLICNSLSSIWGYRFVQAPFHVGLNLPSTWLNILVSAYLPKLLVKYQKQSAPENQIKATALSLTLIKFRLETHKQKHPTSIHINGSPRNPRSGT